MDFKLPKLGEGADYGVVVNLFVKEGDTVAKDQTVLELESEKAVASVPSTVAGTVTKLYVKQGDKISVGARIFAVGAVGAAAPATEPEPVASASPSAPVAGRSAAVEVDEVSDLSPSGVAPAASPSVRKIAADLGIELNRVRGGGRGGRIELSDLKNYIARLQKLALAPKSGAEAVPEAYQFYRLTR